MGTQYEFTPDDDTYGDYAYNCMMDDRQLAIEESQRFKDLVNDGLHYSAAMRVIDEAHRQAEALRMSINPIATRGA